MNNSTQAQKGFKTFLLTLSISLMVFSVIYYIITNTSAGDSTLPSDVMGVNSEKSEVSAEQENAEDDVFGKLAAQQVNVASRAVLAGATESTSSTTQSTTTVPDTGVMGITFGLVVAASLFGIALVVIAKDPRRLAMSSFERKTITRL